MHSYLKLVLGRPALVIGLLALLCLAAAWPARNFQLDASADSLVREGDADLAFARAMSERYGTSDFVFLTYRPREDLFSPAAIARLRALRDELAALERVDSVDSLLDMPLFKVAGLSLTQLDPDRLITLESPGVDLAAAREDLRGNQAYRDVLIAADGRTAGLVVNFRADESLRALQQRRDALREQVAKGGTEPAAAELAAVSAAYQQRLDLGRDRLHSDIGALRAIIARYRDDATVHMGGVPMIADDLVSFVRQDLLTFGGVILLFIVLALAYLFRALRYVVAPLLCSAVTVWLMAGLLGLLGWRVTVISSNFVSLLLIISISLSVHLIVRYRELQREAPQLPHRERLGRDLRDMLLPCAYTSVTTMVAFGSLVISDIPPIISFGWMMVLGVGLAFAVTFSLLPALLALPARAPVTPPASRGIDITPALARFTERRGGLILLLSGLLFAFALAGLSRLQVENSFINYFSEDTEIHRGMVAIDRDMGGTTPLDVIIDMTPPAGEGAAAAWDEGDGGDWDDTGWDDGGWEDDAWEDDAWEEEDAADPDAYWFTSDKMAEVIAIHDYLETLPESGKVLSLGTLLKLAHELNGGEALDSLELAVLYNRLPDDYKESLLRPYVSVAHDQVRFNIRVRESDPSLRRGELLARVRGELQEEFGLAPEQIHLSGMLVLYNNMLQSLFESQILTLGLVLAVILGMFLLLFRSLSLALIGVVPNILAAATVLGLMGWLRIPLDMMTITIAAISVGIGVDNTIHYIHRFRSRLPRHGGDYLATMHDCHESIARAMYYTGFTIVAGFSILVLSNFIPTIYFGLLTALAMILALLGALTLLPRLLILCRPLGGGTGQGQDVERSGK